MDGVRGTARINNVCRSFAEDRCGGVGTDADLVISYMNLDKIILAEPTFHCP